MCKLLKPEMLLICISKSAIANYLHSIAYFSRTWTELKDNSTALIIIAMHTLVLTANIKLLIIL